MRTATAVVNGDVITGTDVDQRVALVTAANDQELSAEDTQRLKMQVLRNLIDETLQIQEAAAQEIQVTDPEVEQRYAAVAQQNFGQREGAMNAYLQEIGSSANSLKRQIGRTAWHLLRNVPRSSACQVKRSTNARTIGGLARDGGAGWKSTFPPP